MTARQAMLFFGAGASVPSGLPTFLQLREIWLASIESCLRSLSGPQRVSEKKIGSLLELFSEIPAEAMFEAIDSQEPRWLQNVLIEILSGARPTLSHYFAADHIERGGTVWTTNFDTLIEDAASLDPLDSSIIGYRPSESASFQDTEIKLLKPHGTLVDSSTWIFRSESVLKPAPKHILDRLSEDIAKHYSVFLGYRGADIDLSECVVNGLNRNGRGVWFCMPWETSEIRRKVPDKSKLRIEASTNPSRAFWEWAQASGIFQDRAKVGGTRKPSTGCAPSLDSFEELVSDRIILAKLFHRFAGLEVATKAYGSARFLRRASSIELGIRVRYYQGTLFSRLIVLLVSGWDLLFPARRESSLVRLAQMARYSGKYGLASRIAGFQIGSASLERRIQCTAALRMKGDLQRALDLMEDIMPEDGYREGDADRALHIAFERSICLRWLGRETEALHILDGLDPERAIHAGTSWLGWILFEKATCKALRGEIHEALADISEAIDIFELVGNSTGLVDARIEESTIHRLLRSLDQSENSIENAKAASESWVSGNAFAREALAFEEAEVARLKGKYSIAENEYNKCIASKSPIHLNHGLLGFAELERDRLNVSEAIAYAMDAKDGYAVLGCRWGECNAILTLILVGEITQEQGEREIATIGYQPPGGSIWGLLFGGNTTMRPLNLP